MKKSTRRSKGGRKRSRTIGRKHSSSTSSPNAAQRSPAQRGGTEHPKIGLEASVEMAVPHEWTIQSYDARLPAVLSTPAMIGMMEMAAARAVQAELTPGAITVGTRIEVDHLKAATLGSTVRAQARLVAHEGRFLVFEVAAHSGEKLIGRGRVFRAIVEPARFATKAPEDSK